MSFFETKSIYKAYRNHQALKDVSISVPEQSVYGLLGPNGAGKTTLIRIINQITAPDQGEVFFNGEKLQPKHIAQIGYLPEERGLYKKMKVGEQAMYLAQLKNISKKEAQLRLKAWFKKFGILDWWDRKVEELSKGMQQKIQFIVTVLHEPKLLIFDEPFSGFDPINANILKEEILRLKELGATVIFSTHNMGSVEEICDHIALINKSQKILEGKVSDVKKQFRSNRFELELIPENGLKEIDPNGISILSSEIEDDRHKFLLEVNDDLAANHVIQTMMNHGTIVNFNEVIPSMNDIFINLVEGRNE